GCARGAGAPPRPGAGGAGAAPPAAGHHPYPRGCREDVDGARLCEGTHERADPILVARLDDHVERVLALHDGFSLDADPMLPDVRPAKVVEEHGAHARVGGRAPSGLVTVADDEQRHGLAYRRASESGAAGSRSPTPPPSRRLRLTA